MAVFTSSSMKSSGTLNVDTLISLLDSVACTPYSNIGSALVSTTSATMTALVTKTITCVTTDVFLISAQTSFSISDGATIDGSNHLTHPTQGRLAIYVNGANNGNDHILESSQSLTTGLAQSAVLPLQWVTGLSGSIDFDLRYNRSSGAGTVYAKECNIYVYKFKSLV